MATTTKTQITAEPGLPQIVITREFAAPRELVYRAHTDPALLVQWLGPRNLTMTVDRFDVRDGGTWRYIHRDADGNEAAFHGVFHGTPSPENGIVQTFEFEGAPGHVSLETLTLEERGRKTLLRTNGVFQSVEDRDAMIASGMERGVNEGMERLDELLARLAAAS
ncbi:MAG TPA: SRPBCC family protein [Ktedonobacterales bacterium]|nr:SRPBCC family protein [Ktedonobacterales bacterium]